MPHKFLSILLLVVALCACKKERPVSTAPIERYKLDGVVLSVTPQDHVVKIDGQKIEGWMDAMKMEYPVKDQNELATLHVGEHITATVFVQGLNFWIGEIHPVR